MIRCASASLVYHDHGREVYACREVSLDVQEGEFLGILGPSGSGKSSLLYLLSGLKLPTSGAVFYQERDMARMMDDERARLRLSDFGFVFQQPYLLGYLSARENVLVAAGPGGRGKPEQADALLDALGSVLRNHWEGLR